MTRSWPASLDRKNVEVYVRGKFKPFLLHSISLSIDRTIGPFGNQ
uniref:Uncharacterized protein n=1 Tax=Arundo donax TaxID=35708 RepID=A0A0A9BE20_ARUDO